MSKFNNANTWENMAGDLQTKLTVRKNVIAAVHTPSSNEMNECFLFYTDAAFAEIPEVMEHIELQVSESQECVNFTKFLDKNIAPHNIISLSIYEDGHPNTEKMVNLTMVHKKGGKAKEVPTGEV